MAARAIVGAGVAVMGHVGLMPQSISVLGGFRPHGQSAPEAVRVLREARVIVYKEEPISPAQYPRSITAPRLSASLPNQDYQKLEPFCE